MELMAVRGGNPIIFFVVLAVVLALGFGILSLRVRRANAVLRRTAQRLGATFEPGGLFRPPKVEFTLAGRPAWLELFAGLKHSTPYTRVVLDVRGVSPGRLHVVPAEFARSFVELFGGQYVPVGDSHFDKRYVIHARPESLPARVFRREERHKVMACIGRLRKFREATIDLDPTRLMVQSREYSPSEAGLMELVKTAEEFLGYLPCAPGGAEAETWEEAEAGCPMCGLETAERSLRCAVCGKPHHAACWGYIGHCADPSCKCRDFAG